MGQTHFPVDEALPPEDPRNQLRAKLNGTKPSRTPASFEEILRTAQAANLIPPVIDVDDAMVIVQLFFVAGSVDNMPGDEAARLKLW